MAYDHELYLNNCRMMILSNQEKLDESLERLEKEPDVDVREDLILEIQGWDRWVQIWKDRLEAAENNN